MAVYNFGSVFGSAAAGYLTIRFWPQAVLVITIIGGALAYAAVGWLAPDFNGIFWAEALFGLLMGCGSSGLIALGALYYPSRIRSTGVGWATAAGRLGSFSGPLFIQFLVTFGVGAATIFTLIAVGACISGLVCLALRLPAAGDKPSSKVAVV
jgi:AAHS family 4-hydroxybenzoate transporter-like MFS transporter